VLQGYDVTGAGWLRGLLIVAVAVVAHAVWGMATKLTPDRERVSIAAVTAIAVLSLPFAATQILMIVLGGLYGWRFLRHVSRPETGAASHIPWRRGGAVAMLVIFFGLLVGRPIIRKFTPDPSMWLGVSDTFYRVGSLVFGGGHVVLPLLATEVVTPGWLSEDAFLAGYGIAQAVPGPLFTFAAYLGTAMGGWLLGSVALVAIFLPSFLLVAGVLPFWERIRRYTAMQSALAGVNASVVGILLAALYDPIWTKAIHTPADFSLALLAFALLAFWRVPA